MKKPDWFWSSIIDGLALSAMAVAVAICLLMLPHRPNPFPLWHLPHILLVGFLLGHSIGEIVPQSSNKPDTPHSVWFAIVYAVVLLNGWIFATAVRLLTW